MKRAAIFLLMFFFFLGITIYITIYQNPLLPDTVLKLSEAKNLTTDNEVLDQIPVFIDNGLIWDIVDIRKLTGLLSAFSAMIICLVAGIHLFIDKFFFKKFFEEPSLYPAIRRGFLLAIVIIFSFFFRLINGLTRYNIVSVIILSFCIEILSLSLSSKPSNKPK